MSWIDDRLAESQELQLRNRSINDGAVRVYELLWEQIKEFVEEARRKGFPNVLTNGTPHDRIVSLPQKPKPDEQGRLPKELHIALTKKQSITAHGVGVDLRFDIDICDDGVVCLKYDNAPISLEDAAKKILDPFFFPELPRRV